MNQTIGNFKDEYRFLSNFWPVRIFIEDHWYASTEHAFQAMKTLDPIMRSRIKNAETSAAAKKLGQQVDIRPDWENVKIQYMRYLVWYKFSQYEDLKAQLLATGDAKLIEGNHWGDRFWGVCKGIGQNWLGRILMEVRSQLQQIEKPGPVYATLGKFIPTDSTFVPGPKRVFVFGSNTEGIHGAGAAATAYHLYGAIWGKAEGLYPDDENPTSYGLPTCSGAKKIIKPLTFGEVKGYVEKFLELAWSRPDLTFFVTRIGCGLAGFTDYDIAPLFEFAPPNCELPPGWQDFEKNYGRQVRRA
jgi:ribA/ribD-fused uncharacterized protein